MRATPAAAVFAAASTLTATTAGQDLFPVDQSCNQAISCRQIQAFSPIGQSFVPTVAEHSAVQLFIDDNGPNNIFNITVRIRQGSINGPIVASGNKNPTDPGWVTWEFHSPVMLTPGATYVIEASTGTSNWFWCGAPDGTNCYPRGTAFLNGAPQDFDLAFRTVVVGPAIDLDQTCPQVVTCRSLEFFAPIGQSFVPARRRHAEIVTYIDDGVPTLPVDPVTLRLRQDTIAGAIVPGSTVVVTLDNPGWTHFRFDEPLVLDLGRTYVIELISESWSWCGPQNFAGCYDPGGGYLNGGFDNAIDFAFKTWVVCEGDIDLDGTVDVDDLVALIDQWGPCAACAADLDADGDVDVDDLVAIVLGWGPCSG